MSGAASEPGLNHPRPLAYYMISDLFSHVLYVYEQVVFDSCSRKYIRYIGGLPFTTNSRKFLVGM